MADHRDVRAAVSLVEVAGLEWDAAKSTPARGDYWAPCPFHAEETPSLHVTETGGAGGRFYCFGCGAKGGVIDYVMRRDNLDFPKAVEALAARNGLAESDAGARTALVATRATRRVGGDAVDTEAAERRALRAKKIWSECALDHPRVATYLAGRGIDLGPLGGVIPPTLRYHPNLRPLEGPQERGGAMVAIVGRHEMVGIHRTWISAGGRAVGADGRRIAKASLGPVFGSPVRLCRPTNGPLLVGEGIETTLAALVAARSAGVNAWAEAAISLTALSGPEDFSKRPGRNGRAGRPLPSAVPLPDADRPGWLPPEGTSSVCVLADPSSKCPDTARAHAQRAVAKIKAAGVRARLAIPRGHFDHDDDFCDLAKKGEI